MPEKVTDKTEEDQTSATTSSLTSTTSTTTREIEAEADLKEGGRGEETEGDSDRTKTEGETGDSDVSSSQTGTEVEEAPAKPVFKQQVQEVVCTEGSSARLECVVGKISASSVSWTKGGKPVKEGEGIKITFEGEASSLVFTQAKASNSGTYTVTVSNDYGSSSSSVDLVVTEEYTETDASTDRTNGEITADTESGSETVTEEAEVAAPQINGDLGKRRGAEEETREEVVEEDVQKVEAKKVKSVEETEIKEEEKSAGEKEEIKEELIVDSKRKVEKTVEVEEEKQVHEVVEEQLVKSKSATREQESTEGEDTELLTAQVEVSSESSTKKEESSEFLSFETEVSTESSVKETAEVFSAETEVTTESRSKETTEVLTTESEVSAGSSVQESSEVLSAQTEVSTETKVEESSEDLVAESEVSTESTVKQTTEDLSAQSEVSVEESSVEEASKLISAETEVSTEAGAKESSEELLSAQVEVSTERKAKEEDLSENLLAQSEVSTESSVQETTEVLSAETEVSTESSVQETAGVFSAETEDSAESSVKETAEVEVLSAEAEVSTESSVKETAEVEVLSAETETSTAASTTEPSEVLTLQTEVSTDSSVKESSEFLAANTEVSTESTVEEKADLLAAESEVYSKSSVEGELTVSEKADAVKSKVEESKEFTKSEETEESSQSELNSKATGKEEREAEVKEELIQKDKVVAKEVEETKAGEERGKVEKEVVEEEVKPQKKTKAEECVEAEATDKVSKAKESAQDETFAAVASEPAAKQETAVEEAEVVPETATVKEKSDSQSDATFGVTKPVEDTQTEVTVSESSKPVEEGGKQKSETQAEATFSEVSKPTETVTAAEFSAPQAEAVKFKKSQEKVEEVAPVDKLSAAESSEKADVTKQDKLAAEAKSEKAEQERKKAAEVEKAEVKEKVAESKLQTEEKAEKSKLEKEERQKEEGEVVKPKRREEEEVKKEERKPEVQEEAREEKKTERRGREEKKVEEEEKKEEKPHTPAAPQIVGSMDDCVTELGDLARFDCRVSAYPDPEITWYKDGNKVTPSTKYELLNFHDDIFSLLIKKVDESDSGRYTCQAKNEFGEAQSVALLNVVGLKEKITDAHVAPSFVTKFYDIEAVEGVPVEFVCMIDGNPEPTVTWLLNGKEVEDSSEILTRRQEDSVMLAFRSVKMEHSGEIICKLKNDSGEVMCKARLRVNEDLSKRGDRPLFLEQPSDKEVSEGGEVTFECKISGLPDPEVTWYYNGRELHESRRRTMRRKAGQKYSLTIREVIPENAGVYTCKAVNRAGDASCAVELSVKELPTDQALKGRAYETNLDYDSAKYAFPPSFTRRIQDQRSLPGRMARFEAMVIGVPEPEVEWQKDGFPLKWGPKYKMGREGHTSILVVETCDTIDEGTYTCNLYNDAGKASCSAQLKVQEERTRQSLPRFISPATGVDGYRASPSPAPRRSIAREIAPEDKIPSMPIDKPVLLDVKPNAAKLSWMPAPTAMLPENAQKITYTVEARQLPSKQWVRLDGNIEATTHYAYNLRPDKEYQFRVKAENRFGMSEPTLPCTLRPREEPKSRDSMFRDTETPARPVLPKTRPYVSDIGKETLQLGWKPAEIPYSGRSMSVPPVSYRVEAQKLPSEEWVPLASRVKKPSIYLSDLEANRDYNIRVRAQTPYGVSQPTEPVWIPRAKAFTGVPVTRPTIVEIEEGTARLQWNRVDIPAFDSSDEPLLYMIEMQEPPSYRWRELARRVPNNYYIVRDLDQGQDYRFRVRAESRDGLLSEPSPATSVFRTLALSHTPIDRLQVEEYDADLHSARLSWQRVEIPPYAAEENPLLYMIEYESPDAEGWRPLVSGVPHTRYRVPDISPDDDYRFRVRALSPYGVSPPSYPTGLYRRLSPMRPLAQDLHISNLEPEGVRLSWRSASVPPQRTTEPVSYQIEALEYPKREWRPLATNVQDTSYRLQGLKPSSDYSFRIRAQTPSGLAEPTAPVTLTSMPVRPRLPSREPIISELGSDSVRLQWKAAELPYYSRHITPITYTVEYQEVPTRDWVVASRGIPETSYTVRGLRGDRDYRFRIRPETEYGPGEYSLPVQAHRRTAPTLPTREPNLSNISPSSATLSWQPASLATGAPSRPIVYRVEGREPPSSTWYEVAGRVPSTSYDLQFLYPDQEYMFRVIADYDGVESEPTLSAYLPRRAGPPKMPRDAPYVSSVQPTSVILAWRSVELPSRITDYSPVTYRIEVQESPRSDWRPLARQINQTHFHVTGLRPDLDYSFRVRAENEFGISDPTDSVMVRKRAVAPLMSQHEPLISDVRSDSLRLSWQPAELPSYLTDTVPITYTVLMQEVGDHSWQPIARRVSGTQYYVTGLSPDRDYSFRVQAENNFGSSLPSFPSRLQRQLKGPIYSPEIEDAEPSSFRLSWKQPSISKPTTYSVETLEPSTWKWRPLVSRLPHPSYKVTGLQPSRDYAFRVRAEVDSVISEPSLPISFSSRRGRARSEQPTSYKALPSVPVERPTLSEVYDDSVRVNWHPTLYHGATRRSAPEAYRLEVRELPDSYWRTLVPRTDAWNFEVTDLRPNQDYAFRVRTVTDTGMSEPSLPVYLYRQSATPKYPLPSPEISDIGDNYIGLQWKLVDVPAFEMDDAPLSFMIEAQRVPDYDWRPVARGVTGKSHRVTGLEPSYDYKFRLRGETSAGVTQPSPTVPYYRKPVRAGVPITNVRIDSDSNQPYSAKLRWNPVYIHPYTATRDTSYTIEVQEPPRNDWYVLARDVKGTSYTVPDLSPKKDYLFRIKARSPGGEYSAPTPPVPYYRTPTASSWEKLPALTTLPVEDFAPIARPYIEGLILKVPPRMSIEKPDMFVISPECVNLSWKSARVPSATAHLSPTTYRVECRHEDSFEWVEKATGIKGLSTEIRGLNSHIDYAFRVRAVNEFGWSESTLPVFLHRPQDLRDAGAEIEFEQFDTYGSIFPNTSAPKMPMDTPRIGTVQDRNLSLTWTPARIPAYARKTPISYVIEKKEPADQDWVPLASKVQDTNYTIKSIEPKQDYLFRIRAENEYGLSEATLPAALTRSKTPRFIRSSASRERELEAPSSRRSSYSYIDSISSGVPPRVPAGRPSLGDITDMSATLSWQPGRMPSYIKGPVKINYIVEAREPPNHLWNKLNENVPGTTYKVDNLRPDQDYMFRVRAFNDSGMSEPTLPVTLTRERAPEVEPRTLRRRSSVERFSSVERRLSRERSMSMDRSSSVRGSSIPRILSRDSSRKEVDEEDMFLGKTPDTAPAVPEFVTAESPEIQYGLDSRPVKISLQLRGLPLPTVDWYFKDKKLLYGDRHEGYVTPTGLVVLEFSPMTWADVGDYKCVAENEQGEATFTVKLNMADPPTFLQPMKDLQLESQGSGQFSCRVDGIPYPEVKFMKDWRPLTETARQKVTHDGDKWVLSVDQALPTDAGCYICVAENAGGKVFCTARLSVDDDTPKTTVYYKKSNFEDDYYILEELGRGRHSVVRRVIERSTGQEYAAKFTKVREEADKDFFRLELDALLRQKGPNIEKLHDAYETQQQLILVSEFAKDGNLLDRVKTDKDWTEAKAAQVIRQTLLALKDVHDSGFLHLDVKPTNLRFTSPDYNSLHLIDFGFSRKLPLSTDLRFNYGTPEFCSPEAIENEAVTPSSDLWAVGVLAHLLLTGVTPFNAESVPEILSRTQACNWSIDEALFSNLTPSAKDFISKLLIRDPEARLSLEACLAHEWLSVADKTGSAKIDTGRLQAFQEKTVEEQKASAVKTVACLKSLSRLLEGPIAIHGLKPTADPQTGEITLPDTEEYGQFLDEESWYDWQSRHQQGPDTELFPLKDAPYTVRVRGYKRAAGSVDEPSHVAVDSDDELDPQDKEKMRTMKERRKMSEIDKEEIPPSLEKELEYLDEARRKRKEREGDEDSLTSKRSSVASISTEGFPGPMFKEKLHDMAFGVDDTVILRCVVMGPPTPTVVWYKNEELLTEGNRVKMNLEEDGEATLTIRNAKPYDAGVYKCVGRNKFGRMSNRMRLQLGDVPGRPGQPAVSQVSSTEALVIWEAPKSDGHSDILFYKLDYRAHGQDRWTTGAYTTSEAAVISGLQPSTLYRFRVSATNRFGTSHYSWSSVECSTKPEGSLGITSDEFFDLPKLTVVQSSKQPTLPTEYDDIVPDGEATQEEPLPSIQTTQPDSIYNIGDLLYKGKFYEEKTITLPSDNDKTFTLRTVPAKIGQKEFENLKSLRHERLVRLFTGFSTDDKLHLVLEHMEGEHIARHLCRRRKYSENMVACIIRQVLYGLEYLQRNSMVHLNLQPASIVLSKLEGCEVKLTDFSLARKIVGPEGEIAPRQGYADFIPPEVVVQDLAGFPADIWGVGTLAFVLLSGVSPFRGEDYETTLVNIALNRYDAVDLYENVTTDALKFLYKVMKRLPRNRLNLQDCLDHKWLQLTDKVLKEREDTIFLTNTLANFVREYDTARQSADLRQNFEEDKLPVQMSKAIPYEARPDRKGAEKKPQTQLKKVEFKTSEVAKKTEKLSLEERLQKKADKLAEEKFEEEKKKKPEDEKEEKVKEIKKAGEDEGKKGKADKKKGEDVGGKEVEKTSKTDSTKVDVAEKPKPDAKVAGEKAESKSEDAAQKTKEIEKKPEVDTKVSSSPQAEKVAESVVRKALDEALQSTSGTSKSSEPSEEKKVPDSTKTSSDASKDQKDEKA